MTMEESTNWVLQQDLHGKAIVLIGHKPVE